MESAKKSRNFTPKDMSKREARDKDSLQMRTIQKTPKDKKAFSGGANSSEPRSTRNDE